MSHNFLGTFARKDIESLIAFARVSIPTADERIRALKVSIERLGWLEYERDNEGARVSYTIHPPNSQLASYVRTFEYYGGDVLSLELRSRGDWIYITKGTFDLRDGVPFAGGKPSEGHYLKRAGLLDDATPGIHVAKIKDWVIPRLKRVEDLEYRIKRTIDLTDQMIEEIVLLVQRTTGSETLDDLQDTINYFLTSSDFPSATET